MKCDELTPIDLECNMGKDSVTGLINREPWKAYDIDEVNAAITELKAALKESEDARYEAGADAADYYQENRRLKGDLWLMTAEWAEGMGLASCNIAIKLSFKERFFYHDEANREKDIKKYKHRQVVFYKYADYCRVKAEEYK